MYRPEIFSGSPGGQGGIGCPGEWAQRTDRSRPGPFEITVLAQSLIWPAGSASSYARRMSPGPGDQSRSGVLEKPVVS